MFIELHHKYRVNINNVSAYYPVDDTRIRLEYFQPYSSRNKVEYLMCGTEDTRNRVLERLDEITKKERIIQLDYDKDETLTL